MTIDSAIDLQWRLTSKELLVHRCWDNECLVYNDCSGDTHLLEPTAMRLLMALQDGPLMGVEVARSIGASAAAAEALAANLELLSLITTEEC